MMILIHIIMINIIQIAPLYSSHVTRLKTEKDLFFDSEPMRGDTKSRQAGVVDKWSLKQDSYV